MYENLNSNKHVEAISVGSSICYYFDGRLYPYFKSLTAGSVNCSRIFKFQHDNTGILKIQENTTAPICSQDMKKGSWSNEERTYSLKKEFTSQTPIKIPSVKTIK